MATTYATATRMTPGKEKLNGRAKMGKPVFQKSKKVKYGTSDQLWSSSTTIAADAPSDEIPKQVDVVNTGRVPLSILAGYKTYSDETTSADSGNTRYLHVRLRPSESWSPPINAVISTENASTQFDGTAVDNVAPNSNMYTDSTADTTEGFADDDDTTITFDDASGGVAHNMFKVNDLIRLDN